MDKYEQELFPSINSKKLDNHYENSYMNRFNDLKNPAEVYHENSKIHNYEKEVILQGLTEMYKINSWARATFNAPEECDLKIEQSVLFSLEYLDKQCNGLLSTIFNNKKMNDHNDFADILLLINNSVYYFNRISRSFILQIKNINVKDMRGLFLEESYSEENIYFFLIARPWRYMRFIGNIGYRKCLLDIGALSENIKSSLPHSKIIDLFYDNAVHEFLNLDGIENICLRIISCNIN